jgi:hypothetical protein
MKSHLRVYRETGRYVESKEYALCNFIEDLSYSTYYIKIQPIPHKERSMLRLKKPPSKSRIDK